MPHNPHETHCSQCDVQYVHSTSDDRICPLCGFSPDMEEEQPLPQDNYNYDPDGDGW